MKDSKQLLKLFALILVFSACTRDSEDLDLNEALNGSIPTEKAGKAPLLTSNNAAGAIDDAFIVVFKDDAGNADNQVDQAIKAQGVNPAFVYRHAIKGFSAKLPAAAIEALRNNPFVKYIEQDQQVSIEATQSGATWGLDRIDQTSLPLNGTYNYDQTGSGVDAYIFDTGIRLDHTDFGGRAIAGYDAFGGNSQDGNGHGTHVAGTVGGAAYGVAKNTRLIAVRVLDNSGSGSWSGVVAGIDWAVGHHGSTPAVGNMSLGGGGSTSVDDAVRRAIADGITMCVAAGNSTANASNYSPARVSEAITVGATTSSDGFSSYSNFGSVVDLLAPGSSIKSAWYTSSTATNTISGTSMATPHVAGAAALYLEANPGTSPASVQSALKSLATPDKISSVPSGTANLLLYSVFSTTPVTIPAAPALSAPSNGATGVSTTPNLSWNTSAGATSYTVQVSTDPNFSSAAVNATTTSNTYSATGLSGNTTYYWRVSAQNSAGTSAWSQVWSFTTLNAVSLTAPILLSPANAATNIPTSTTLSWQAVGGAASYEVQISTRSNFSRNTSTANTSNTSASLSGLARNTNYYWRVRAVAGSTQSDWSTAWVFKTTRK
jgi:subtilisin family serine protease